MELQQQIFFTTLAAAFAVLHAILYAYNRSLKSVLYFTLFLIVYGFNLFVDFQGLIETQESRILFFLRIHRALLPFAPIFILRFLHEVLQVPLKKPFWFISMGLILSGAWAVVRPVENFAIIQFFLFLMMLESLRIIIRSIHQKNKKAWILVAGFGILLVFSLYDSLMDLDLLQPIGGIVNGHPFGFLFLILASTVYLARDQARMNQTILAQEQKAQSMELERRLLEAEDRRKSQELEDARSLQLSMLPQSAPGIPGMEICFDMRTATEVGGDYYDYRLTEDGTLTLAMGDATGHGLKAGILVATIKSLFMNFALQDGLIPFFALCSRTVREMHLKNLYMSLVLVRIREDRLTAASAGMPPIYIYRHETRHVEELLMKGPPLGAVESFHYQILDTRISPGDVVLIMSDGLPELMNSENEMLDYPRIKSLLSNIGKSKPDVILRRLLETADEWRNGIPLNDDISLTVIRLIPPA